MSTTNFGGYRLCVQANSHRESRGILKDVKGRELNAKNDSMELARNAPLLCEVRRAMINGIPHPVCERCNLEDEHGAASRRKVARQDMESKSGGLFSYNKCVELTSKEGRIDLNDFAVLELELRMGNQCNLRCRSCSPSSSSSWMREWKDLVGLSFQDADKRIYIKPKPSGGNELLSSVDYQWYKASPLMSAEARWLRDLKKIYITGGEPLMIREHFEFLRRLVDMDFAKDVELDYNSNMTVLPEDVFALWPKFKRVNVGVSLDGPEDINNYIRHPSKFSVVVKNLKRLDDLPSSIKVWITCTVMIYNAKYIPEFLDWIDHSDVQKFKMSQAIVFHNLLNPEYLRVDQMPDAFKAEIEGVYHNFLKSSGGRHAESLSSILNFMKSRALDEKQWSFFLERTESIDRLRKHKHPRDSYSGMELS